MTSLFKTNGLNLASMKTTLLILLALSTPADAQLTTNFETKIWTATTNTRGQVEVSLYDLKDRKGEEIITWQEVGQDAKTVRVTNSNVNNFSGQYYVETNAGQVEDYDYNLFIGTAFNTFKTNLGKEAFQKQFKFPPGNCDGASAFLMLVDNSTAEIYGLCLFDK